MLMMGQLQVLNWITGDLKVTYMWNKLLLFKFMSAITNHVTNIITFPLGMKPGFLKFLLSRKSLCTFVYVYFCPWGNLQLVLWYAPLWLVKQVLQLIMIVALRHLKKKWLGLQINGFRLLVMIFSYTTKKLKN